MEGNPVIVNFILMNMGAPQGGSGQSNPFAVWLPLLIIISIIFFFIRFFRKKESPKKSDDLMPIINQTNKRIIGIILASVGGVGGILFGLVLSSTTNRLYLFDSQKEKAMTMYGILAGVSILLFIVGLIMIITAKNTNESSNKIAADRKVETSTSKLDELEKLASLKEKGIITEEEFNAKKKKILEL